MGGLYRIAALLPVAGSLIGQVAILPLAAVRPGMVGMGKTVFSGTRVEEFRVEILGVLQNVGPRQSLILGRLSGGPLEKTGVLQGMSGSPVYLDGKLIGAVALSFAYSKEPIAGIRPIEEMTNLPAGGGGLRANLPRPDTVELAALLPKAVEVAAGGTRLREIATPLWFSGFTQATMERFGAGLREAGLEVAQGTSGGGVVAEPAGGSKPEPGSMISVQLMTGDLNVGADGTVTHVDGNRVYAFGHRFLSTGETELPFARAEVLTLLASQQMSFKISTPREWMGTILQDRSTAIAGELGRRARLSPLTLKVRNRGVNSEQVYRMEMANDRFLSPVLLQMAVYSVLDATERMTGASSVAVHGAIEWTSGPPVRIDNMASGEWGVTQQASAFAAIPLSYALQSNFDALRLSSINLELDVWDQKRTWQIDGVTVSPREARPGETVKVAVTFSGPNEAEHTATVDYRIPIGAPVGPIQFTASDALTTNVMEYQQFFFTPPRNVTQLREYLNGLKPNTKAYVRVSRNYPSYRVQGETLPSPPPSLALLLSKMATNPGVSRLAEYELAGPSGVISGSRLAQVEVKE